MVNRGNVFAGCYDTALGEIGVVVRWLQSWSLQESIQVVADGITRISLTCR